MIVDANEVTARSRLDTDLCIIGGGAAGITIAREFAGTGRQVVVLESGGEQFDGDSQQLYEGEGVGLPYFPLHQPRLRFLGGATNHWGGMSRIFNAEDFEARDGIPHTGWPVDRDELAPYYERAWDVCHLPDRGPDDGSPDEAGSRFAPFPLVSDRVATVVARVVPGRYRSFSESYRDDLARARNVRVYLYANVIDLRTDDDAAQVTAVDVATLDGNRFEVRAQAYVLACGGIENARLLLASDAVRPAGLGNDHDLVGRFFTEHPRFEAGRIVPADPGLEVRLYEIHDGAYGSIRGYLGLSPDTKREEGLLDVQIRLAPVYDEAYEAARRSGAIRSLRTLLEGASEREVPDELSDHVRRVLADLQTWQRYALPGGPLPLPRPEIVAALLRRDRDEVERLLPSLVGSVGAEAYRQLSGRAPVRELVLLPRLEPVPNPDSRITLADERDALGMRRARLDWRLAPDDAHAARRSLEIVGEEFGRAGLGRLRFDWDGDRDDEAWPDDLRGGSHHMGTTRMSDDPRQGVVDARCSVHGVDNLYVAGSSIFTTGGAGTPTLTLVAFALRLADHLEEALR
jgi:choline dehydrogenase-like flavoprotein